jgi:hypothetical protein
LLADAAGSWLGIDDAFEHSAVARHLDTAPAQRIMLACGLSAALGAKHGGLPIGREASQSAPHTMPAGVVDDMPSSGGTPAFSALRRHPLLKALKQCELHGRLPI